MDFPIVLGNSLFPVQAFFNAIYDRNFISTLQAFSKGIGAGFNDAVCEFPNEIEEGDEIFKGVKFYIFNEELILSKLDFIRILWEVSSLFIARHPEHQLHISHLIDEISKNMGDDD